MAQLTDEQLAQIKAKLQRRYLELLEEVRGELERSGDQHYADLVGGVADPGDDSVADMLVDVNATLVDRQISEMREIEAALKRLADLDFGDCIECGGEIGFERLMAYPTARRCIRCQALHEKTYMHENNPTL
ncbi:TraR/DksA family transcriptional regulator [Nitrosovibrio tenuis]|uniref:Transcriptional regulator, TraR/DksA family n=1 Tax=Nitrosovibrio tenuis TaxID=1233 RepID=A0A1H7RAQ7_9PROT|nr:TraR/DksA family transcriptional regulator [Nitrosovibrio tenuis]SEL57232.1 transcriptional regulator, TraR/DksA family [Nitrosovibrio tenuis]